jgi:hypothetical protein
MSLRRKANLRANRTIVEQSLIPFGKAQPPRKWETGVTWHTAHCIAAQPIALIHDIAFLKKIERSHTSTRRQEAAGRRKESRRQKAGGRRRKQRKQEAESRRQKAEEKKACTVSFLTFFNW